MNFYPMYVPRSLTLGRVSQLILSNLLLAVIYGFAAHLSVEFASLPGKITAVWLPSGITLAAVLTLGSWALPGIFLGSIAGITQDLLSMMPHLSRGQVIVLDLMLATANCLQPLLADRIIQRFTPTKLCFDRVNSVIVFVLAAISAPTLSATLGIAVWGWTGALPRSDFGISWLTWWLASALAHLIFTPPLLLWRKGVRQVQGAGSEMGLVLGLVLILCWLTFDAGYSIEYMLLPLLLWAALRSGQFSASLLVSLVSGIAILATAQGHGAFVKVSPHASLLLLQSFTAVCSLTTLLLSAAVEERRTAQAALQQTLDNLEQQVNERARQLRHSEALLDGFFAAAPVGMGIVDAQLRCLRSNEFLAVIDGVPLADRLGKPLREVLPELAPVLEPLYRHVFATRKPLLNQEVTGEVPSQPGVQRTWLTSYFPIFDPDYTLSKVGVVVLEISDRKQAEMALEESEARYRSVVTSLTEGIVLQDASGAIRASNASAEEILGLSLAQMAGRTSLDPGWAAIHEDGSPFPGDQHPAMETLRTGQPYSNVIMGIQKPDDRLTWISINSQPLFHSGEQLPYAVVASFSDITARKQAELALQESEERFRAFMNHNPAATWITDAEGRLLCVNPNYFRLFQLPTHDLVGKTVFELFEAEIAQQFLENIQQVAQTQQVLEVIEVAPRADGSLGEFLVYKFPLSQSSQPCLVAGLALDITERRQAEEALRQREEEFRALAENAPDIIMRLDRHGRYLYINPTVEKHCGLPPSVFLGKTIYEQEASPDLVKRWQTVIDRVFETGQAQVIEFESPTLTGVSYYASRVVPEFASDGSVQSVLAIARDISDYKRTEAALRASQDRFAGILEIADDAIISVNIQQQITLFNQGAEKIFGYSAAEVLQQPLDLLLPDRFVNSHRHNVENFAAFEGRAKRMGDRGEIFARRKDGSEFPAEASISKLEIDGEIIYTVILRDISERKRAEEVLKRLATLDGLTQIANRRCFDQYLSQEWRRLRREQSPLALLLCDIDYFKNFNDHYGHQAGDSCLQQVAQTLERVVKRPADLVARYGGEEFAVILPGTGIEGAIHLSQQIQQAITQLQLPHARSQVSEIVTVSIGIASRIPCGEEPTEGLVAAADKALYAAKAKGRNTYCISPDYA